MRQQHHIFMLPFARRTVAVSKIATLADTKDFTKTLDGELVFRLINIEHRAVPGARQDAQAISPLAVPLIPRINGVRLRPSLAKKTVAFFKMSRSWRSTSISRRSRLISADMSSLHTAPDVPTSRS